MRDHGEALRQVVAVLRESPGCMPHVIGHRLVNGGPTITDRSLVDDAVWAELVACKDLAPIHNPPAMATIQACREVFPGLPQVVVSDTAFHRTMPLHAQTYAIPTTLSQTLGIRKYGYHGISHQYVVAEVARQMGIPVTRFSAVSCHLGSGGASLCAVVDGQSIDNTMGYSPLQGLVMSTRCGDLDPGITLRLLAGAQGDRATVERQLNQRSGVLGLSGNSADIRDAFESLGSDGDADRARTTTHVYLWRLKKYLGAYLGAGGPCRCGDLHRHDRRKRAGSPRSGLLRPAGVRHPRRYTAQRGRPRPARGCGRRGQSGPCLGDRDQRRNLHRSIDVPSPMHILTLTRDIPQSDLPRLSGAAWTNRCWSPSCRWSHWTAASAGSLRTYCGRCGTHCWTSACLAPMRSRVRGLFGGERFARPVFVCDAVLRNSNHCCIAHRCIYRK